MTSKFPTCPNQVWLVVAEANFDKLLNEEEDTQAIGSCSESKTKEKWQTFNVDIIQKHDNKGFEDNW